MVSKVSIELTLAEVAMVRRAISYASSKAWSPEGPNSEWSGIVQAGGRFNGAVTIAYVKARSEQICGPRKGVRVPWCSEVARGVMHWLDRVSLQSPRFCVGK